MVLMCFTCHVAELEGVPRKTRIQEEGKFSNYPDVITNYTKNLGGMDTKSHSTTIDFLFKCVK
jgi:hypothetical protein